MIQLRSDCLVFEDGQRQGVPCSVEDLAAQVLGDVLGPGTREVVRQAALAVLHYFKHEMGREAISLGEFTLALEQALKAFGVRLKSEPAKGAPVKVVDSDLRLLASASGAGCELAFFPLLQAELRQHMQNPPELLRFWGLRGCVKQLLGVRRWTAACQQLSDQIVEFLRRRLRAAQGEARCAMVVW